MFKRRSFAPRSTSRTTFSAPFLTVLFSLVCVAALFVSSGPRLFLEQDIPCDPGWGKGSVVTLTATRDDAFFWDQRGPFPAQKVGPMLDAWLAETPNPSVLISADDTARFGTAVVLLGEVRQHGIGSVVLDTRTRTVAERPASR